MGYICILFFTKKHNIEVKHILLENIIIFSFIGFIEYMFFANIAAKYIPVTPDILTTTALDRIKTKLSFN